MTDIAATAFEPRALALAIEIRKPVRMWYTETYFPQRPPVQTAEIILRDVIVHGTAMAPIQRPSEASRMLTKDTGTEVGVRLAYMKPGIPTNAEQLLRTRGFGSHVFAPNDLVVRAQQELGRDTEKLHLLIDRRVEYMASVGYTTGTTPIVAVDENGVPSIKASIVWGVPAAHLTARTGDDLWTAAASNPIDQIRADAQLIIAACGMSPTTCTLGIDAAKAWRNNTKVQAQLDNRQINAGQMELLASGMDGITYLGTVAGIAYYEDARTYTNDAGNAAYYTPIDRAVLGCSRANGVENALEHGPISDLECQNPLVTRWTKTWVNKEPSQRRVAIHTRVMPCLWQPDSLTSRKVV